MGRMIFEGQLRNALDVILLANEQDHGHHQHVTQGAEARRPLRFCQASDRHADSERADREDDERHPKERPSKHGRIMNARQERRQNDAEGRVKEKLRGKDLAGSRRAQRLGQQQACARALRMSATASGRCR